MDSDSDEANNMHLFGHERLGISGYPLGIGVCFFAPVFRK